MNTSWPTLLATRSARTAQYLLGVVLFAELRFDGFRDTMVGVNTRRIAANDEAQLAHLMAAKEGENLVQVVFRLSAVH